MTKKEFIEKYCSPTKLGKCKQVTWDLCSDIEDTFNNEDIETETAIGSAHYDVDTLLEVVREDLPDYEYLKNMEEDLKKMSNKECCDELEKIVNKQ